VVQVDLDFTVLQKNIHVRITKFSFHFKMISLYTNILFSTFLANHWCPEHNKFHPDCIANSGHRVWVHDQIEISVLLGAPSMVQTNENHWGLSQSWKKGGSWFPAHCCQCHHQICICRHMLSCRMMIIFDIFPGFIFWIALCTTLWSQLL
jgi:hypothetical protein